SPRSGPRSSRRSTPGTTSWETTCPPNCAPRSRSCATAWASRDSLTPHVPEGPASMSRMRGPRPFRPADQSAAVRVHEDESHGGARRKLREEVEVVRDDRGDDGVPAGHGPVGTEDDGGAVRRYLDRAGDRPLARQLPLPTAGQRGGAVCGLQPRAHAVGLLPHHPADPREPVALAIREPVVP